MTVQLPYPYIPGDDPVEGAEFQARVQQNLDKLAISVADFGGSSPRMRWGTAAATIPGGTADTDTITVSHGLGVIPAQVLIASVYDGTGVYAGALRLDGANAPTASVFKFFGRDVAGTAHAAGSVNFSWIAIG